MCNKSTKYSACPDIHGLHAIRSLVRIFYHRGSLPFIRQFESSLTRCRLHCVILLDLLFEVAQAVCSGSRRSCIHVRFSVEVMYNRFSRVLTSAYYGETLDRAETSAFVLSDGCRKTCLASMYELKAVHLQDSRDLRSCTVCSAACRNYVHVCCSAKRTIDLSDHTSTHVLQENSVIGLKP